MDRRTLVAAVSGAMLIASTRPLLAQTSTIPIRPGTIGAGDWHGRTLMAGSLALQTSELAQQRAVNGRVKEFAGFERAEQITMAQVVNNQPNPPPTPLDAAHAPILQQLEEKHGADFDAAYVAAQMQLHQELQAIQNSFLDG